MKNFNLGKTLTSEEVCKLLHISKRKCAWMLQNGIIPCIDSGKKTRRYTIYEKDVYVFIEDCKLNPEKYTFPVSFSSKPSKTQNTKHDIYYLKGYEIPDDFKDWLDDEWCKVNDVLYPFEICDLLGYSNNSIRRWINKGWLKYMTAQGKEIVPKEWLLDFMCDRAFIIEKKSTIHRNLLKKYFDKENKIQKQKSQKKGTSKC